MTSWHLGYMIIVLCYPLCLDHFQLLYSIEDLSKVNTLIRNASKHLRRSLVTEMEASHVDDKLVEPVHQSTATLQIPWDSVLQLFQMAMLMAVHKHYREWHAASKRKISSSDRPSHKKQRSTCGVPQSAPGRASCPWASPVRRSRQGKVIWFK